MAIVITMCKLLLAMGIGFYLYKSGVFSREINAKLSTMIARITNPCLLIYSVSTVAGAEIGPVLKLFFYGCAFYAAVVAFAWVYVRIARIRIEVRGTYMCMMIFANCAFMGYPVVSTLYGPGAIFYSAIFNMPFNFLIYTLGEYLILNDVKNELGTRRESAFSIKKLFTPGIISAVLALVIFFTGLKLPEEFYTCMGFVGEVTIPLSMIIIGSSLAAAELADIRGEKGLIPLLIARFAIIPGLLWGFMSLLGADKTITAITVLTIAMPVGTLSSMLAAPYPTQGKASGLCVVASTLLSIVTIPVWIMLIGA